MYTWTSIYIVKKAQLSN